MRAFVAACAMFAGLAGGFGMRVAIGVPDYLHNLYGDRSMAEQLYTRLMANPLPLLGPDLTHYEPGIFLILVAGLFSLAFAFLLLAPVGFVMSRIGATRFWLRALVMCDLAIAVSAATLLSIHPILSLKQVPEGPRTALNYLFEAVGYDWVNALAYAAPLAAALLYALATSQRGTEAPKASAGEAVLGPVDVVDAVEHR